MKTKKKKKRGRGINFGKDLIKIRKYMHATEPPSFVYDERKNYWQLKQVEEKIEIDKLHLL